MKVSKTFVRHFWANFGGRPGILSNRIPIRKNPGTFDKIRPKVAFRIFEKTFQTEQNFLGMNMSKNFIRHFWANFGDRPRILSNRPLRCRPLRRPRRPSRRRGRRPRRPLHTICPAIFSDPALEACGGFPQSSAPRPSASS